MRLFIIQPFSSHIIPTFGLAHALEQKGETVVYTSIAKLNNLLSREGFNYVEFPYLSEYVIRNSKICLGFFLKSLLSKEFYAIRKKEFSMAFENTEKLLKVLRPNQVYLDQSLAEYYFFIRPFVERITILHTKFYSGKIKGIPPMNSTFIPKDNMVSKGYTEWLWFKVLLKQRVNELAHKLAFLGKDEVHFWKEHCKNHGLNWRRHIDLNHALNRGIKDIPQIILAPKELEFDKFREKDHLTFYHAPYLKNESSFFSKEYMDFKKNFSSNREMNIIYMAFGTLTNGNPRIEQFFNTLILGIKGMENTVLIVSKGNQAMNLIKAPNTFALDFVPQQDVLAYANLFITHGGLGSLKEAYQYNVPMLVVPINKRVDQNGNAARVVAKGMGDYINIHRYSYQEVLKKIERLLHQKQKLKLSLTY